MSQFTVDSLTSAILDGWKSEGFTDVGHLEKFAKGIAKGVYGEVTRHTVTNSGSPQKVFDPKSI